MDKEVMMAAAMEMAGEIACRSPVATQGTKINLIYSRDHSVAEGLDYMVRGRKTALFMSEDFQEETSARIYI